MRKSGRLKRKGMASHKEFREEQDKLIRNMSKDKEVKKTGIRFIEDTLEYKYSYNFEWLECQSFNSHKTLWHSRK